MEKQEFSHNIIIMLSSQVKDQTTFCPTLNLNSPNKNNVMIHDMQHWWFITIQSTALANTIRIRYMINQTSKSLMFTLLTTLTWL